MTITVTSVNDEPVPADDAYTVAEDSFLITDAISGVLANDTDADGDVLAASLLTDVSHGTLTLSADGSFTYTPDADYVGTDTFDYIVSDGNGGVGTGTVTIEVTSVNDEPVAVDDTYTTPEDTALAIDPRRRACQTTLTLTVTRSRPRRHRPVARHAHRAAPTAPGSTRPTPTTSAPTRSTTRSLTATAEWAPGR